MTQASRTLCISHVREFKTSTQTLSSFMFVLHVGPYNQKLQAKIQIENQSTVSYLCRYKTLKKPSWSPGPSYWVASSSLGYAIKGYTSWAVWTHGGFESHKIAFGFFYALLALELTWPFLCFKARKLDLALISSISKPLTFKCQVFLYFFVYFYFLFSLAFFLHGQIEFVSVIRLMIFLTQFMLF